jgi:hypothetical protein
VFHAAFSAVRWKDSYSSSLVESAISNGVVDWRGKNIAVACEVPFARAVARNGMWVKRSVATGNQPAFDSL